MTDDEGCHVSITTSIRQPCLNRSSLCSGEKLYKRMTSRVRQSAEVWLRKMVFSMQ